MTSQMHGLAICRKKHVAIDKYCNPFILDHRIPSDLYRPNNYLLAERRLVR
jgi:hypothetical protein